MSQFNIGTHIYTPLPYTYIFSQTSEIENLFLTTVIEISRITIIHFYSQKHKPKFEDKLNSGSHVMGRIRSYHQQQQKDRPYSLVV